MNQQIAATLLLAATTSAQATLFQKPQFLQFNDSKSHSVCAVFADAQERTVLFSSNRSGGKGGFDLYLAQKSAVGYVFQKIIWTFAANTAADELMPFADFRRDDIWTIIRTAKKSELYVSHKSSGKWGAFKKVGAPINGTNLFISYPALSDDGRTLYFTRRVTQAGREDTYYSKRSAIGKPWGKPVAIPGSQSVYETAACVPGANGNMLTHRMRATKGGAWRWVQTHVDQATGKWVKPYAIPELGSVDHVHFGPSTGFALMPLPLPSGKLGTAVAFRRIPQLSIENQVPVHVADYRTINDWFNVAVQEVKLGSSIRLTITPSPVGPKLTHAYWAASVGINTNNAPIPGLAFRPLMSTTWQIIATTGPSTNGVLSLPINIPKNPAFKGLVVMLQGLAFQNVSGLGTFSEGTFLKLVQ